MCAPHYKGRPSSVPFCHSGQTVSHHNVTWEEMVEKTTIFNKVLVTDSASPSSRQGKEGNGPLWYESNEDFTVVWCV